MIQYIIVNIIFIKKTRRSTWTKPKLEEITSPLIKNDILNDDSNLINKLLFNTTIDSPDVLFKKKSIGVNNETPRDLHRRFGEPPINNNNNLKQGLNPNLINNKNNNEWVEVFSPEHSRSYYYNKLTKQSVWVDPRQNNGYETKSNNNTPTPNKVVLTRVPVSEINIGSNNNNNDLAAGWKELEDAKIKLLREKEEQTNKLISEWERLHNQVSKISSLNVNGVPVTTSFTESPNTNLNNTNSNNEPVIINNSEPTIQQPSSSAAAKRAAALAKLNQAANPVSDSKPIVLDPNQVVLESANASNEPPVKSARRNSLAEDLDKFTNNLLLRSEAISSLAKDRESKEEADAVRLVAEDLVRQTTDVDISHKSGLNMDKNDAALIAFGNSKVRDIPVDAKQSIKSVKKGLEYAKAEKEAQRAAQNDAARIIEETQGGYYNVLNVPKDATQEELKRGFHKGMIKWHPDKVKPEERDQALEMANVIRNAYQCLSDKWERDIYDWFGLEQYLLHTRVIQCFKNYLFSGVDIIKHPRNGWPRKRVLWLDPNLKYIYTYKERLLEIPDEETQEKIKGVLITDILEIRRGVQTKVFERTGKAKNWNRYFSLVTELRTLDFEAPTPEVADFLAVRLTLLIIDLQKNMKWMKRHYDLKQQSAKQQKKYGRAINQIPNNRKWSAWGTNPEEDAKEREAELERKNGGPPPKP